MPLIDDNYVKTILESNLYELPLREHRREIIKKIILLFIQIIIFSITNVIICNFLIKKEFYIKVGKPIFIILFLGFLFCTLFVGIKGLFLLYKDWRAESYEIVKDNLLKIRNSSFEKLEDNTTIISQLFLLEKLGEIKIGSFEENLLYSRKRRRSPNKQMPILKESTKSELAIPYSIVDSLYEKFESNHLPTEVYIIKSSGTKQIITILTVK